MVKATNTGRLNPVEKCVIEIPIGRHIHPIKMNNLPDISDTKSAVYNNEGIIGRSFPLYTYSHSADRQISMQIHFFATEEKDITQNMQDLRAIQSATYPRSKEGNSPYIPPPVCRIRCGMLLAGNPNASREEPLCAVLQSYSVKFPTEVAWHEETYCPYRFDVDTTWLTVYSSEDLPFQNRIFRSGR